MMSRLFTKILLWFLLTVVVSLTASFYIWNAFVRNTPPRQFNGMLFELREARKAWEAEGRVGLERALGPQLTIPLPYAMRERIQERENGEYQQVIQSFVELEIENGSGEIMTVRRDVVGGACPLR